MMSSLFSAVSGMKNHQTRMDVIGNNIANVNTYGFKAGRVTFQDQLSQTLQGASMPQNNGRGGTNPMQKGLGVGIASIDTLFTDGSYQSTGKATDLSIQGDGFFILSDGATQYYTRAGNFDFDTDGNYVVPGTGLKVMGWMADANGAIALASEPAALKVPVGKITPAQISTNIVHAKNLSADSKPGATNSASIDIYDSQGIAHKAKTTYSKLSDNTWLSYTAVSDIMTDAAHAPTGTMQLITFNSDGTLQSTKTVLDASITGAVNATIPVDAALDTEVYGSAVAMVNGIPTTIGIKMKKTAMADPGDPLAVPPVPPTTPKWQIDYTVNGKAAAGGEIEEGNAFPAVTISGTPPTTVTLTGNLNAGAAGSIASVVPTYSVSANLDPIKFTPLGGVQAPMSITIDLSTVSQFGGDTSLQATDQDGNAAGSLNGVSIDTNGMIIGKFTNGKSEILGRVALANFNNPAGLEKAGTSLYARSNNSGTPQINGAGIGGLGMLNASNLEMSNVDLSEEFSNMIITQRGFQSNARVITTSDEMLQELTNLKR
ncbi:flagellar hook protein FlgE [Succinispira mobilis]|uniref:flagellar hook protein FlgE n=1 Tax=Succinispira mobilis TaxID=78120 RepID=UPI00035CE86E|nr:flagellar hook protein FlgE [Succinispira mobilis]